MKHSIVLVSLLGCFAANAANRSAAAAAAIVSSEADTKSVDSRLKVAELTEIIPSLPGSTQADKKSTVAAKAPSWQSIARKNDIAALNRAIAQGQVNVPSFGQHALIWITEHSRLDMLRTLLAAGANPNWWAEDSEYTPLGNCINTLAISLNKLSEDDKRTFKTMIFCLLNAGALDRAQVDPADGSRAFTNFASATAFHAHLFDVGALILEHGTSAEDRYTLGGTSAEHSLAQLASIDREAMVDYAQQVVRIGARGREARKACLESYKPTVRESLTNALLPDLIKIVLGYAPPTCEHIHFTAFIKTEWSKNLDYPLVKEDEWRKLKPGKAAAPTVSEISGHRRDSEQEKPAPENAQGCCTIS